MTPYLRAANVRDGRLMLDDVKDMNFTPRERDIFELLPGDVLVSEGSGSLKTVGASAVYQGQPLGPICFQNTLLRLRPRTSITDGRYLGWWARHAFGSGLFASVASGANIYHLSAERLKALPIAIPPIDEQRRISDFLDIQTARISGLISRKRRLAALLEERGITQQVELVTGRAGHYPLRDSGLAWLDKVPSHWHVRRLKYVAHVESGHTPSRSKPELWENCTIPWITLNDVASLAQHEFINTTNNLISEEGLASSSARVLPAGTVVLSRDATIGRTGILTVPMATSQHFVDWICGPELLPRYLWLVFRTVMQNHFDSLTDGATIRTIGMPDILELVVPLPPIGEQEQIVAAAEQVRNRTSVTVGKLRRQVELLEEHRQALVTAAVTGKLDMSRKVA